MLSSFFIIFRNEIDVFIWMHQESRNRVLSKKKTIRLIQILLFPEIYLLFRVLKLRKNL